MPDTKISALTALTAPASGDLFPIVDISDTTMAASGTTKGITYSNLGFLPLAGGTITGTVLFSPDNTLTMGGGANRLNTLYCSTLQGNASVMASGFEAGTSGFFYWASKSVLTSPSDGVIKVSNFAGSDFNLLQFGGTSASFPALKRSAAELHARLADDSGYATTKVQSLKIGANDDEIRPSTGSGFLDLNTSQGIKINPGGAFCTIFNSSGNVGIGTASPSYQLHVNTDSAGKPGASGLWTVVSDERIKENIVPADLSRCYDIVKQVGLKHYGYKPGVYTDAQVKDRNALGWIAQDVQKVFSKAVSVKQFTLQTDIPDGTETYEEQAFTVHITN